MAFHHMLQKEDVKLLKTSILTVLRLSSPKARKPHKEQKGLGVQVGLEVVAPAACQCLHWQEARIRSSRANTLTRALFWWLWASPSWGHLVCVSNTLWQHLMSVQNAYEEAYYEKSTWILKIKHFKNNHLFI